VLFCHDLRVVHVPINLLLFRFTFTLTVSIFGAFEHVGSAHALDLFEHFVLEAFDGLHSEIKQLPCLRQHLLEPPRPVLP